LQTAFLGEEVGLRERELCLERKFSICGGRAELGFGIWKGQIERKKKLGRAKTYHKIIIIIWGKVLIFFFRIFF
jgi:hypothetical protein